MTIQNWIIKAQSYFKNTIYCSYRGCKLGLTGIAAIGGAMSYSSSNFALAQSQIVPDQTLGGESSIVTPDSSGIEIDSIAGGARRGSNLFHSFEQFSVLTGRTAYFNNSLEIQNIFSRVTGGSISNIDGLIRTNGTANLFLLNPNGIIFSPNAALDIGGSFVATTANSVKFADGSELGTTNTQFPPVLTVSVPVGLGFGSTPGEIIVQSSSEPSISIAARQVRHEGQLSSTAQSIDTQPAGTYLSSFSGRRPDILPEIVFSSIISVQPGKTLALVGGNVTLDGAFLSAPGGQVELGGLAEPGTVGLIFNSNNLSLSFPEEVQRADVRIDNETRIYVMAGGGGSIAINARNIDILRGSLLEAGIGDDLGSVDSQAGDITLKATGAITFNHLGHIFNIVDDYGTGNGGNINIQAGSLFLDDSMLLTATLGKGNAGNIFVQADSVSLDNFSMINSSVYERARGNGGDINIKANSFSLRGGSTMYSFLYPGSDFQRTEGNAGNVNIDVRDSVTIEAITTSLGFDYGGIFSSVSQGATGNGGNINIKAGSLFLSNRARLDTSTFGQGNGGKVSVQARDTVSLDEGRIYSSVQREAVGNGGDIDIQARSLSVSNQSELNASTQGSGNAGNININARQSLNANNGEITAAAAQTGGGNINITSSDIRLRNSSLISTRVAESTGGGGDITIKSNGTFIALEDSDVLATAFRGNGGNIKISSPVFLADIFGGSRNAGNVAELRGNDRVDISASSQFGTSGVVDVPDFSLLQNSFSSLSGNFVSPDRVVAGSCLARRNVDQGSFTVTGTGGLQPTPYSTIDSWYAMPVAGGQGSASVPDALGGSEESVSNHQSPITHHPSLNWKPGDPIVEAKGIVVLADGRTLLSSMPQQVATATAQTLVCHSD